MAYREFDNFDPTSNKQVNPLEGLGESVARGIALGQNQAAHQQRAALAKQQAIKSEYEALGDIDTADIVAQDRQTIFDGVSKLALETAKTRAKGLTPSQAGLPQKYATFQQFVNISKQDEAEIAQRKKAIEALPTHVNKSEMLGRLNAEVAKGAGNRNWAEWDKTTGNIETAENAYNVPELMANYSKVAGEEEVKKNITDEKNYTTTKTDMTATSHRLVKVDFDKNGNAIYSVPKENQVKLVEDIFQFDPVYAKRQLRAGERLVDDAAKKYAAATGANAEEIALNYKAGKLDAATQTKVASYLPPQIKGTTPGEIATQLTLNDYTESMKTKANYVVSNNFDRSGWRLDQQEKRKAAADKDKDAPTLNFTKERTYVSPVLTTIKKSDGTQTKEYRNKTRYTGLEVGMQIKGKDVEIQTAPTTMFDYTAGGGGKRVNAKDAGVANRSLVLSTAKLVIRKGDGVVAGDNWADLERKVMNDPNPEKLKLDFLMDATAKNESDGAAQNSMEKTKPKTYGIFGADVETELRTRGIDLLKSAGESEPEMVSKYQNLINKAIEKKRSNSTASSASASAVVNKGGKSLYKR